MKYSFKQKVIKDFSNVSYSYGEFSQPQQNNYLHLWSFVLEQYPQILNQGIMQALDVGTGSGKGLKKLINSFSTNFEATQWILCDISAEMLRLNDISKLKVVADMDSLPFHSDTFPLILSNFALHWSDNIEKSLSNMLAQVDKQGMVVISLPLKGSFQLIEDVWLGQDLHSPLHNMPCESAIQDILEKLTCSSYKTRIRLLEINVSTAKECFNWLKKTGVKPKNKQQNRMNKKTYFSIVDQLSQRFQNGERLTFQMMDCILIPCKDLEMGYP